MPIRSRRRNPPKNLADHLHAELFQYHENPDEGHRGRPVLGQGPEARYWRFRVTPVMTLYLEWRPSLPRSEKDVERLGIQWTNPGGWTAKLIFDSRSIADLDKQFDAKHRFLEAFEACPALAMLWFRLGDWHGNASRTTRKKICRCVANALRGFVDHAHDAFLGYFSAVQGLHKRFPQYLPPVAELPHRLTGREDGRVVITANEEGAEL